MTFEEAKHKVAMDDGSDFGWDTDYEFRLNMTSLKIMMTKAAELYATAKAAQALEEIQRLNRMIYERDLVIKQENMKWACEERDKEIARLKEIIKHSKAAQAWEEGQDAFIAAYKDEFKDEHLEYLDFMKDRIKPTNPYLPKQEKP